MCKLPAVVPIFHRATCLQKEIEKVIHIIVTVMMYKEILRNVCICRLGITMIRCSTCRCTGCGIQSE